MVITRWINLGAGPDEKKPNKFLVETKARPQKGYQLQVEDKTSALPSAFEGGYGFNLDSFMTPYNVVEMFRAHQGGWELNRILSKISQNTMSQ